MSRLFGKSPGENGIQSSSDKMGNGRVLLVRNLSSRMSISVAAKKRKLPRDDAGEFSVEWIRRSGGKIRPRRLFRGWVSGISNGGGRSPQSPRRSKGSMGLLLADVALWQLYRL